MIHLEDRRKLYQQILGSIAADASLLEEMQKDVRALKRQVHQIRPRSATAISFVATDGGNNRLEFDPFLVQLIRVVDSSDNEYWMDAVTPSTNVHALSRNQFDPTGAATTALGAMMKRLGVSKLDKLSPMIRPDPQGRVESPSWIGVYRELVEWAVLLQIITTKEFGSDTILVCDGLLRSKVFSQDLFARYIEAVEEAIELHWTKHKRRVYVVGLAKHSKVLSRYRLAMAMERVLSVNYPAYVEIPRELEEKAYVWKEFARGADVDGEGITEAPKFVGGKMFLVKFGSRSRDPIWPVDILLSQVGQAHTVLSFLLADAQDGFPVPFYPRCLQKAHENAALVEFDYDVLQDGIYDAIRALIEDPEVLDSFRFLDHDPASGRYR